MELVVSTIYTSMHLHLKSDVINAQYHGWHKGWGYGAAATPDFKDAPMFRRILIFIKEIFSIQYISPTCFCHLPPPLPYINVGRYSDILMALM